MQRSPKPLVWSVQRELTDRGWTNGERAVGRVSEYCVHQVVSEVLLRRVADAKAGSGRTRKLTAGELLDTVQGSLNDLPGTSPAINPSQLLVQRPLPRLAKGGEVPTSALKPAASRLTRLLGEWGIYSKPNAKSAWSWALRRGFAHFLSLSEEQRASVLSGRMVHAASVIAKKPKAGAVPGASVATAPV